MADDCTPSEEHKLTHTWGGRGCVCGWTSGPQETHNEADRLAAAHMKEADMTTDEGMKFAFIIAAIEESPYWDPMTEEAADVIWDEWIARVRRDAAREALSGLEREAAGAAGGNDENASAWVCRAVQGWAEEYRDTHYPEDVTP